MTLPRFELKEGYDGMWHSGKGYEDPVQMLQDIYEGVKELGPKCTLLASDHPQKQPPEMGFYLSIDDVAGEKPVERSWEFTMKVRELRDSVHKLPPGTKDVMLSGPGRQKIARMLKAGLHPRRMEERLNDPTLRYIAAKVSALEAALGTARLEEQVERQRTGNQLPYPSPKLTLLQLEITTLVNLVNELEKRP